MLDVSEKAKMDHQNISVSIRHLAHGWSVANESDLERIWMLLGLTSIHLEGLVNAERKGEKQRKGLYEKDINVHYTPSTTQPTASYS